MKPLTEARQFRNFVQAQIAKAICKEQAIDCGYAALASAIEGNAWERNRNLNLMRRLVQKLQSFDRISLRVNRSKKG